MQIVTRCSAYTLLDGDDVKALMDQPSLWMEVEDSKSGPRRTALDLGVREMEGTPVRVIASRFRIRNKKKKRHGSGRRIDDWQYELYFATLPHEAWAANDLVTLYYGRTAIENRFAAEDREFDLRRVLSFTPTGQLSACAIAMSLWNWRIALGLASVPNTAPSRKTRIREVSEETDATRGSGPTGTSQRVRSSLRLVC